MSLKPTKLAAFTILQILAVLKNGETLSFFNILLFEFNIFLTFLFIKKYNDFYKNKTNLQITIRNI